MWIPHMHRDTVPAAVWVLSLCVQVMLQVACCTDLHAFEASVYVLDSFLPQN